MRIDVKADVESMRRQLYSWQREALPKAAAAALNRVADSANTMAVRELADATGLKQKDVRAALSRTRATWANLESRIAAIGRALNLIRFGARKVKQGVSAAAWGQRKIYAGTFIANQGRTVFRRDPKARMASRKAGRDNAITKHNMAIVPVYGPSIPREFGRATLLAKLEQAATAKWRDEFARQLRYYLSKVT